MPTMPQKRTALENHPAVYRYTTRRGVRYIAVAMHDRKQRWQSGFPTIKAAEAWREDTVVAMRRGQAGKAPARMTLHDYIETRWWPYMKRELGSANTIASYSTSVAYVQQYIGVLPLRDIEASDVEDFKAALTETGLGAQTRRLAFSRLRQALRQAVIWGLITRDPTLGIKAPTAPKYEAPEVTERQLTALLQEAEATTEYGALVLLAVMTGLRWGELTALTWENVDVAAKTLRVRQAKTRAGVRTVALGERTVERLQQHRLEQMRWATELGAAPPSLCFTDAKGVQLHRTRFYLNRWNPLRKRAGLPGLHFHDLRHVHASLMGRAKVHPSVMQHRLGHASAALSLDIYTSSNLDQDREAAAAVEALVGG